MGRRGTADANRRAPRRSKYSPVDVIGDERLLKMLLAQVRTTPEVLDRRDQVRIESAAQRDVDGLQLWVSDDGCGFNMAYAEKVFEPFKRVHGPGGRRQRPWAGDRAARGERHGGSIDVQSTPGTGTTIQ